MKISNNYIAVEKLPEEEKTGFQSVDVQDNFLYKGKVYAMPETPVYMGNTPVAIGDTVVFAKYSPDTHEYKENGLDLKFVSVRDVLAVL